MTTTFQDDVGREWRMQLTAGGVRDCRELLSVDLCDLPVDIELVQRLRTDDVLLVNVIYVLCKPQADEAGVSDEAFGRSMGSAIAAAEQAFWEVAQGFFRGQRQELLRDMLQLIKHQEDGRLTALREELTPEYQTKLVQRFQQMVASRLGAELSGNGSSS